MSQIGKLIIIAGVILVIAGAIISFAGNKLDWFGNLPGDIKIEKENVKVYFPVTTMIILSIVLSFLVWLVRKFF
jgi:H+/Cl- antiporter ClcA